MAVVRGSWCCLLMAVLVVMMPTTVMGRTVAAGTIQVSPYLVEAKRRDGNVGGELEGFIADVLAELGKQTGLTFTLTLSDSFGSKVNGTWTGLVGDVVSGKVEMAAAPLTITSERRKDLHFSVPFQNFGPVIVMRRPRYPKPSFHERFQHLFAPLTQSVWLMAGLAYFVTSFVLYVISYVNPYEWRHLHRDKQATLREGESFTCMNTFWFVMSSLMWQGYTRAPRSLGGRLVATFWWMFVVVLLLTYTASLTNMLRAGPNPSTTTMEHQDYVKIMGLEDLAKQSDIDFGFVAGGSTESYLREAKVPYLRRIWHHVSKKQTSTLKMEDGITKVREAPEARPFAFVMESAMANYILRQRPCDLYMVGDLTITGAYALAFRPGWDLADKVDEALLVLKEEGMIKLLEDKWFGGQCHNNVLDPTMRDKLQLEPAYVVTLGSFSGVLVLLLAGVVGGALVTIIEIIVFKKAETTPSDEAAQPMKETEPAASNKGDKEVDNVTDV